MAGRFEDFRPVVQVFIPGMDIKKSFKLKEVLHRIPNEMCMNVVNLHF